MRGAIRDCKGYNCKRRGGYARYNFRGGGSLSGGGVAQRGGNPRGVAIVEIKCKKCGSNKFILRKKIHYEGSLKSALISELLCHGGFGWDVNTFDFVCAKCGAVNEDYVDVQEVIS